MNMDLIMSVMGVSFFIIFMAFIFIKSYIDDKKRKKVLTEIFMKYGVKTNAKIISLTKHHNYGRYLPGKYNYYIEFQYISSKIGVFECSYHLPTNNPMSLNYSEEIPIIYIPAYIDYYYNLIDKRELFSCIGHKLTLSYNCNLIMFAEDIDIYTNIVDL